MPDMLKEFVKATSTKLDVMDNDWENGVLYGIIMAIMGYFLLGKTGAILFFVLGFLIGYRKTPRYE